MSLLVLLQSFVFFFLTAASQGHFQCLAQRPLWSSCCLQWRKYNLFHSWVDIQCSSYIYYIRKYAFTPCVRYILTSESSTRVLVPSLVLIKTNWKAECFLSVTYGAYSDASSRFIVISLSARMTSTFDTFQFSCQSYWKDGETKNKRNTWTKHTHTHTNERHTLLSKLRGQ